MLKKIILCSLVLNLIYLNWVYAGSPIASPNMILIPVTMYSDNLYIPHTQKQVDGFWSITKLCPTNEQKKEYSGDIVFLYLDYLILNIKTKKHLDEFMLFRNYSDGYQLEGFNDLWIKIIKTKSALFKSYYLSLDAKSRRWLGSTFTDFFDTIPKPEKEKWIKELKLKKETMNGLDYYW